MAVKLIGKVCVKKG